MFLHKTSQSFFMDIRVFARLLPTELGIDTMVHIALKITGFTVSYYLQVCRK